MTCMLPNSIIAQRFSYLIHQWCWLGWSTLLGILFSLGIQDITLWVLLLYRVGWIYPYLSLAHAPDLNLISLIIKSPLNHGSVGKESTCNVGDAGRREFDPWVEKISLEEGMATAHSSILAWRIPWTEEPGGLQSMGSHRAGQDWSDWACMQLVCLLLPYNLFSWEILLKYKSDHVTLMCKNLYYLFHMSSNRTLYDYNLALQSVVITRWWYSRVLSGPRYHLTRMRGTLGQSKKQQNTETNKKRKQRNLTLCLTKCQRAHP